MLLAMRQANVGHAILGLLLGATAGLVILATGTHLLLIIIVLILGHAVTRSLAFLAGAFLGLGGAWLALTLYAQTNCDRATLLPMTSCASTGTDAFITLSLVVIAGGLAVAAVAWRTHAEAVQ